MEMISPVTIAAPDVSAWSPATWSAAAAWVTVFVLIVAAGIALWQAQEARRLRQEQSRPWVSVDFEFPKPSLVNLVIANFGRTVARDVTLEFDPPPTRAIEAKRSHESGTLAESVLLTSGIPTLPPGKRVVSLFDSLIERDGGDHPERYTVVVRFADYDRKRRYESTYELDLGFYLGLDVLLDKDLTDLIKSVDGVRQELHKWTAHGGLKVLTTDRELHSRRVRRNEALREKLVESPAGRFERKLRRHWVRLANRLRL